MKSLNKNFNIAPCGINCNVCMAFLRTKNKCPGCSGDDSGKPKTRLDCKIKTCESLDSSFCFSCNEYPCSKIKHLDKRYTTKYKMSVIENLNNIKTKGIINFANEEKARWTCPDCKGTICVHKACCISCGRKRD